MAHSTILRFQPVPTMLIFLSPAKSLDFTTPPHVGTFTQPGYLQQSETLIRQLRQLSPADIARLMDLSDQLALLNFERYADWSLPLDRKSVV